MNCRLEHRILREATRAADQLLDEDGPQRKGQVGDRQQLVRAQKAVEKLAMGREEGQGGGRSGGKERRLPHPQAFAVSFYMYQFKFRYCICSFTYQTVS